MEKSTKSLLSVTGIVAAFALLALALAGCGGAAQDGSEGTCTYQLDMAPWTICNANGMQTRTVVSLTESTPGCATIPSLEQACTYVVPAACPTGDLFCSGIGTPSAGTCCPSATPLYFEGSCYAPGTTLAGYPIQCQ